jgi:hypothetical protein
MKKLHALALVVLLAISTTAAARPGDGNPPPTFIKRLIRIVIKFVAQPHDPGIIPPHP